MTPPVRVLLLGCGRIARLAHLEVLRTLREVEIAAIADSDEARLAEAGAHAPGAARYRDFNEAIAQHSADAAVITLPPALHAASAIAALRAGLHIYLEKPIAASLEEAEPVLDAWRAGDRVAMIGFNYRFHPALIEAKRVLAERRLGEIVAVRSVFAAAAREQPPWKRARATGGGALINLGSHHIDLAPHLLERSIERAEAELRSVRTEHDTALLRLRLDDGTAVQSFFSMVACAEDRWEFYGTDAKLTVDRYAGTARVEPARAAATRGTRMIAAALAAASTIGRAAGRAREPSYGAALGRFVDAVHTRRSAQPDLEDGYRSLRAIVEAEAHAETHGAEGAPAAGPR